MTPEKPSLDDYLNMHSAILEKHETAILTLIARYEALAEKAETFHMMFDKLTEKNKEDHENL